MKTQRETCVSLFTDKSLIAVLLPHERGLSRHQVINELWIRRGKKGLNMPAAFEESVQASFQAYAGEYATFKRRQAKAGDDLFFPPRGKGVGWWAVRRDRAEAWIVAKKKEMQAT